MPGIAATLALLVANPVILQAEPKTLGQEQAGDDVVQGDADRHERMTVPVAIERTGPWRFLIDTGSQRTVVSRTLADRLALERGPIVRIVGIAGENDVGTAKVEEMELGEQTLFGLEMPLLEGSHMGADGIVGTDSLQGRRVLLDFQANTIAIGDQKSLGGNTGYEIVVRARRRQGQLIMTNALIDGIRTDVVIDTGASWSIGNLALQKAIRERNQGTVTIASVTGQTLPGQVGYARELKIDDLHITNVVLTFADSPAFAQLDLVERPALFLGMRELRAFRRVAIDFQTRRVLFDLDQVMQRLSEPSDFSRLN